MFDGKIKIKKWFLEKQQEIARGYQVYLDYENEDKNYITVFYKEKKHIKILIC